MLDAEVLLAITELTVIVLAELLIRSRLPLAVAGVSVPVLTTLPTVRARVVATELMESTRSVSLAPMAIVAVAAAPPEMLLRMERTAVVVAPRVMLTAAPDSVIRTSVVEPSAIALVPPVPRFTSVKVPL